MKPLDGIKVVDFTQAHAGSLATMILADFGAEVIKIERAGVGDMARYWVPMKGDDSAYYTYLNRGKKSISLNAASPEGKEILVKLIKDADVLCENFKLGSMERMGLTYEEVKEINPTIIYASLNGFGQTGPMKNTIGLDLQLQAMSGLMDRTGFPDGAPTKAGPAMGDQLSGTYMAMAINLALVHKRKTGEGQRIDISILDSLFSILEAAPMTYCLTGEVPERVGNSYLGISPYDALEAKDGYVAVGISTDRQWGKFCTALGMDEIGADERYKTNELRGIHYETGLKDKIEAVTKTMSKFDIEAKLRDARLAGAAVYTVADAMASDQIKEREMLQTVTDKALGEVTMPGTVIKMSETPGGYTEGAPLLGENTTEYLTQIGYSAEEIAALVEKKIIELA
ncbi:CaiB/BaiF CoA-transferase family protein [Chakrabartyella piscis]|uniref:CaiB/BaiF CoA transferase family protein n=1 Tax=Chakrabartyella piscis TaxID=2918914 RepID=UPI002958C12D|nr:CaiB/BaiF CoA-transferase family protein [Chakrabartyella piscis]